MLHNGLVVKRNVSLRFVRVLRSWYSKLRASVQWNRVMVMWFPVIAVYGRVTDILSPMLFSILFIWMTCSKNYESLDMAHIVE